MLQRVTGEPECCDLLPETVENAPPLPGEDPSQCPLSKTSGHRVDLITLKALLKPKALMRLEGRSYRFCAASDCDIVYFDNSQNSVFRKADLTVRVGLKEHEPPVPVCYCFDISLADILRDLAVSGKTDLPDFIAGQVKAGRCACEVRNPEGRCCLGNVNKAVTDLKGIVQTGVAQSLYEED